MSTITETPLINVLQTLKAELIHRYGDRLVKILLFGSQARGDAEPTSDIDVLVILRGKVDPVSEILANSQWISNLCLETETVINCLYLSQQNFESQDTALLKNIRQEGIMI